MFCPFFHDFCLFWNSLCCQRDHKFSGTEWHTSSRNRVVRRRMCKIGGFPLCNPFKGLLWDSSEVHSILKYTKCLMFEMWHIYTSVTVFYYSSKDSGPIDMLDKFWVYDVNVFYETVNYSQKKLNRLLRFLWHCALRTICGCRFFQIVVFFDFGNCWFEISVYFIHIFHLFPWCDTWATVPLQVISKLSYNRPRCVRNGVVPDNSVMSYTFPAACIPYYISAVLAISFQLFHLLEASYPSKFKLLGVVLTLGNNLVNLSDRIYNNVHLLDLK